MKSEIMDEALMQKYIKGTVTEQETDVVRKYLMEIDDMEHCYELIFKIRQNTMEVLGIENDFIENETNKTD
jgi:hypothetical protein